MADRKSNLLGRIVWSTRFFLSGQVFCLFATILCSLKESGPSNVVRFSICPKDNKNKNLAHGRHRISQPMRIEATNFFVYKWTSPPVEHLPRVNLPRMQSGTTSLFKTIWVCLQVQQSTNQTPPMHGLSMYAIQNNSLFLGL